ncbi:MAG: hypothetical protein HFJ32_02825 [Clostridia bacterium]|nr:hypothetical protein [Clostridia bacterium]
MEKKKQIFEKFNMKDYTNRLEKILEKKQFSLDTKNLLLSMLYKIENGYPDYEKTKVEVPTKNEFIENLFQILQRDCEEIIVAEFNSEASNILKEKDVKYIIEEENKRIIAYANELLVMECILKLAETTVCIPQEKQALQTDISNLINIGSHMNQLEAIRDFNGWSWDIVLKEIQDLASNVIFQTLLYLIGNEFIQKWIQNNSNLADYIELLKAYIKENFGEKRAEEFVSLFCKLAIDITASKNEEQRKFWKSKTEEAEKELKRLQNKEKFLEDKTKEKKKYTKQIEDIDKMLNNKELLKKEYEKRNSKLPNKEKIFSISHLTDKLNNERDELLEQIKECNSLITPKGYITRKQEIEEKVKFLTSLDLEQRVDRRLKITELCSIFLECFQIKIVKAQTKQDIIDYIYELRYYGFLILDEENIKLKETMQLKPLFEECKKSLLEKARKLDVLEEVTEDKEINEQILSAIFDSKMIDLDHMVIETSVKDGKLYIKYYDEKVLENTVQLQCDRTVRLKKKVKLFI